MPRRSATVEPTTTTPNGKLGDLDAEGREVLPDFGPSPRPTTCDALSAWQVKCTNPEFHSGAHSWGGEAESADSDASNEDEKSEQAELPGTPAAESDLAAPVEGQFNGADFMVAAAIEDVAESWIRDLEGLSHLRGIRIVYFWKRRGGLKGGNKRLGNLAKVMGLAKHALGRPVFALWLAADHVRELHLEPEKVRAAVLHELCKAAVDPDDHDAFRVVGPDAEVFALELQTVGLWSLDLREMGANVKQLGLLESLDPDAVAQELADADDEANEAEEDE